MSIKSSSGSALNVVTHLAPVRQGDHHASACSFACSSTHCFALLFRRLRWRSRAERTGSGLAAGAKFFAQNDEKGEIAAARDKHAADPKNIDLLIALGRAEATVWRYRDAIATYTRGIEIAPNDARLYRHRGHRYISIRAFDKARADLQRAAELNANDFDIWYHLALSYYLLGDLSKAEDAYRKCLAVAEEIGQ